VLPPPPSADAAGSAGPALAAACQALGLAPTSEQESALLAYLALLQRWNATYNLTAVRDPQAMLTQHLADCLAVVPSTQRWAALQQASLEGGPPRSPAEADGALIRVLDVGSGGGLPGVVLALMLPGLQVECVDTVGKKAAFVRQVAAELALPNLQARHARVEQLRGPGFDLITARAFSSLADLVRLTRPLLKPGGAWMALKGKHPADEIAALPPGIVVFHVEPLSVPGMTAERCLVWLRPPEPTHHR
jgi:16S rRNA (guanine527-N7)-methyltransferase